MTPIDEIQFYDPNKLYFLVEFTKKQIELENLMLESLKQSQKALSSLEDQLVVDKIFYKSQLDKDEYRLNQLAFIPISCYTLSNLYELIKSLREGKDDPITIYQRFNSTTQ